MAVTALSDAELLQAARNGDEAAFTELYVRHHDAAHRLASTYRRGSDADDLVNGAFERVLGALRRGGGPTESFRAYLFVTLRRLAMEDGRHRDEPLEEVPEPVLAVGGSPELEGAERQMVSEAFESLPGRWQAVLWHTAVEGRQPREIAGVVGLSANAAAALAYRARERLRQAYLQAHLQTRPRPRCEPHRSRLGGYVRDGLSRRDHTATAQHLEHCESCRSLVTELTDVNRMLVRSVAPTFLLVASGSKIAGLVSSAAGAGTGALGAGAAGAAGAAGGSGGAAGTASVLGGAWSGVRRAGTALGGAAAAAAAAITLAVTIIPNDGGPSSEPDASWVAGPPPAAGTVDDTQPVGESRPATPRTLSPGSAGGGSPSSSGSTPSSTAGSSSPSGTDGGPLAGVDAEVGLSVDLGDGVEVDATVDLALNLNWVPRLLGNGTLEILVPNRGTEPVDGLEVDVQLSANARAARLLSGTCQSPSGGLLGTVLGLVTSLTCGLGSLAPGATANTQIEVQVAAQQQTATVSVRLHGEVVAQDRVALPL